MLLQLQDACKHSSRDVHGGHAATWATKECYSRPFLRIMMLTTMDGRNLAALHIPYVPLNPVNGSTLGLRSGASFPPSTRGTSARLSMSANNNVIEEKQVCLQ